MARKHMAEKRTKNIPPALVASSSDGETEEEYSTDEEPQQQRHSICQKEQESKESDEFQDEQGEETGSGSDSESDSDDKSPNSPTASAFTIKPIASKPLEIDSPKSKKPTSKSAKRPAEFGQNLASGSSRKKSKVSNEDIEDGPIEEKKSGVNRLWSEDDEIGILKGMIDYKLKKGVNPYSDRAAFHEFVKVSLHVDFSMSQLYDKIRRLKKKYLVNVEKGQNGEEPAFSKPHEHKVFEVSKKIWGRGGSGDKNGVDDSKVKGSKRKDQKDGKVAGKSAAKVRENRKNVVMQEAAKEEIQEEVKDFWSLYPRLSDSLESELSVHLSLPKNIKNFVKEIISSIGKEKASKLEQMWNDICVEELKLYAQRVELIGEQAQLVLDVMKPSNS